ncbi:hypothetical protein AcetOrient_orf02308 [Acetobacter orientalis]|uniref:Uncharacterized protein n=1 Tax=Acetobacter orientalis TaxID=146474 RepID=A0A2Z5ZGQ3_9PROT|nr:hypothetical protein AcetOrient_orf02308 [Acetobacter orientalis]
MAFILACPWVGAFAWLMGTPATQAGLKLSYKSMLNSRKKRI